MKLYYPLQTLLSILGILFPFPLPGESPPRPKISADVLSVLESRVDGHDTEILELQNQIEALRLAIKCPCGRGGKCICPPDACLCPNCPEHHKKAGKVSISGRKALVFGASWCGPCKTAQENRNAAGLLAGVDYTYHDVDQEKALADKYNVKSLPFMVRLNADGMVHSTHIGPDNQAAEIKSWLSGKVSSAGVGANAMGAKPSAPAAIYKPASKPAPRYIPATTVTRGNGPGHTHRCGRCGTSWSHENWNVGSYSAHRCPGCGSLNYGNRTEGWSAPYRTRSQPVSYQQSYQPRVVFASGGGYCPTCPRR